MALADHFKNKAKDPFGLFQKLKEIQGEDDIKVPNGDPQNKDINGVLVYNIASLAYQTQNYGQSLLHLKLIIENMDQVEEFI